MSEEQLITFGSTVKALGGGKVGGHLVRFSGPGEVDLEYDYFDASTDYGGASSSAVYYNHGLDPEMGKKRLGDGLAMLKADELGIWIEHQLDLRNAWEQAIYEMVEDGKLGWSSGTAGHLIEREQVGEKAYHILSWPLGLDASLTPTPADPYNTALPLKSWAGTVEGLEVEAQEGSSKEPSPDTTAETANAPTVTEVKTMSEKQETPAAEVKTAPLQAVNENITAELDAVKASNAGMSEQLNKILAALEKAGPMKDAGYVAPDSEADHPETKSFADFLMAIRNGNETRLKSVYKALGEQSGTAGGYLVPTDYEARLLQVAQEAAVIRPRATVIPVATNQGEIPSLNQGTAPTAGVGQSAFAGGVRAYWTGEAGSVTSTDPVFDMVEWKINKVAGYTQVSNELIADSAIGLEALLNSLFGQAVAAVEDYAFIRGTGAGMPLGILAAPCVIAVTTTTNNQFAIEDAMKMLAQFQPIAGSRSQVWILHRGLIPDLYSYFEVVTAGVDLVQPREMVPNNILGYPILYSEHMPAPDSDDAILADLAAYVIFDRQGLQIAYSEHAAFTTDEGVWRFTKRLDGKPWLDSAITLADAGGATTVSPFLYHND